MTQEMHYGIRFSFPFKDTERERILPAVDLFLRALEEADRLMAGSLGLEVEYHRALKEMGETQFYYTVLLSLHWPRQILLGNWPEPGFLGSWMGRARRDLFTVARAGEAAKAASDTDDMIRCWDRWAKEGGLAEALVYTPPAAGEISPITDDLERAFLELGGGGAVTLE